MQRCSSLYVSVAFKSSCTPRKLDPQEALVIMFLTFRSCIHVQAGRKVLMDRGQRSGSLWCCVILCLTLMTHPHFHWCPSNLPSCSMETLTVNKTHAVRIDCFVLDS